jgi:hypothetical protein
MRHNQPGQATRSKGGTGGDVQFTEGNRSFDCHSAFHYRVVSSSSNRSIAQALRQFKALRLFRAS